MKPVKLITTVLFLVAFVGACNKGPQVGRPCTDEIKTDCVNLSASESPTPSPTPTKSRSVKPTASASAKPTVAPPTTGYKPRTYTIVIRNQYDQYEPAEKRVYQSDIIIFKNLDKTHTHSWTEKNGAWDSGELKYGETYRFVVDLKPGKYYWKDTSVPYIAGGPLDVLAVPKA